MRYAKPGASVRAVLDTTVGVSGVLWKASPRRVLDAARDQWLTLNTSSVLLDELAEVLSRAHLAPVIKANRSTPELLMRQYAMLARVVMPAQINRVVAKNIDDDAVLACALAAQADWILSGDAHLLNLKRYQHAHHRCGQGGAFARAVSQRGEWLKNYACDCGRELLSARLRLQPALCPLIILVTSASSRKISFEPITARSDMVEGAGELKS